MTSSVLANAYTVTPFSSLCTTLKASVVLRLDGLNCIGAIPTLLGSQDRFPAKYHFHGIHGTAPAPPLTTTTATPPTKCHP